MIIGGSGLIGSKIVDKFVQSKLNFDYTYLKNNLQYQNGHKLDITNNNSLINLLSKINPDIVIHTAALTNVDKCETNQPLAKLINIQGTKNIVEACKIIKSKIIFLSSSYIFDGEVKEYFEDDKPNPKSYYGLTKYESEQLIKNSGLDYLILRTDQPYCWNETWQKNNSVTRVINNLKNGNQIKEIIDWYNNPTYVPNFIEILENLISKNFSEIFHFVGPNFLSRYEWSLKVCEIFNLNSKLLVPIKSDQLNLPFKRNKIKLNTDKISRVTGNHIMSIDEGLRSMYFLKNHHNF